MTITAAQLRAARALIKLEQKTLAEQSGVAVQTLKRWEGGAGPLTGNFQQVSALIGILENAGVEFLHSSEDSGAGVRLKRPE